MNKELKDKDLENVAGGRPVDFDPVRTNSTGTVTLHNMPQKNSDEKYVMNITSTANTDIIGTCGPESSE